MSDDSKPAYLRGCVGRGRGVSCPSSANGKSAHRPGLQNKEFKNRDSIFSDSTVSQRPVTSGGFVGGESRESRESIFVKLALSWKCT